MIIRLFGLFILKNNFMFNLISTTHAQGFQPLTDIGQVAYDLTGRSFLYVNDLGQMMEMLFYVILAVAVILAVYAVIGGGYMYMTSSDNADKKTRAKKKIQAAFGGLLLAFGTVLILQTVNPGLVNFQLGFQGLQQRTVPEREPFVFHDVRQDVLTNALVNGLSEDDLSILLETWGSQNMFDPSGLTMGEAVIPTILNGQLSSDEGMEAYYGLLSTMFNNRLDLANRLRQPVSTTAGADYYDAIGRQSDLARQYDTLINRFAAANSSSELPAMYTGVWDDFYSDYQESLQAIQSRPPGYGF
jgi:hypothetical protein